jgi:hypothetical protein
VIYLVSRSGEGRLVTVFMINICRHPDPDGVDVEQLDVADLEDLVFSIADATDEDAENMRYAEDVVDDGRTALHVRNTVKVTDPALMMNESACIAYESCLIKLADARIPKVCPTCGSPVEPTLKKVGTAMYLIWVSITTYTLCMQGQQADDSTHTVTVIVFYAHLHTRSDKKK